MAPKRMKAEIVTKVVKGENAEIDVPLKRKIKAKEGDVNEETAAGDDNRNSNVKAEVNDVVKATKKMSKKSVVSLPNLLPGVDWFSKSESKMFVGAHVSIAGGIENAVFSAAAQGCQAMGLFLCNQRTWNVAPLTDEAAVTFRKACVNYGYPSHLIVPHASYLMNVGSHDNTLYEKSLNFLIDGLSRCDKLGIDLFNFHPGSTCGKISREESITKIANAINTAHGRTEKAIAVLENMCKQGNTIGGDFNELRQIIDRVKDKSRVGVCLDTCHAFAAGYDLKTEDGYNKMMDDFDTIIGFKYLKALHLNDSKGKCDSHLDRHENIGKGLIGTKGFERIMNEKRFMNIPMILETPTVSDDIYKKEVIALYKLHK